MTELPITVIPDDGKWSTQSATSPFRYPGGKAFLTAFLAERLASIATVGEAVFCEPFCGGAGAALNLLSAGLVREIHLNDADIRIHSAWKGMLEESERFVDLIRSVPLTMDEWYRQQTLVSSSTSSYSFEVGFAAFYMNRTTRSGIIERAGPIGGYDQTGKWKIDARFNRERLSRQVEWLARNQDAVKITNLDALAFLDRTRKRLDPLRTLFFIDPPYVKAGGRLYMNGMTEAKHIALADLLLSGTIPHWVVTYDDAPLIRQVYRPADISHIRVNYSLQSKRKESELLVLPA